MPDDDTTDALPEETTEPVAQQPVDMLEGSRLLHPGVRPKNRAWGCQGCKLFQYAPCFTKANREVYEARLDPERRDKKNGSYMLEGDGPTDAEVMVVIDSPTRDEDTKGRTAIGGAAIRLREYARAVGLDPDRWYFTYAVKCRGPEAPDYKTSGIYCSKFLAQDVMRVKPKVVIALGTVPTAMMLGKPGATVMQYHAVPQKVVAAGHPCTVFPMWSVGYVSHNDYLTDRYLDAWEKLACLLRGETSAAVDKSLYQLVPTVDEAIAVCHLMMEKTRAGKRISVDLETSGLSPYQVRELQADGTTKPITRRVSIISLACGTKRGYGIPYDHDDVPWTAADRRRFLDEGYIPLLTMPGVRMKWHNGKFDYKWHYEVLNVFPVDIAEDTMLTHYSVDENEEHGLKPLSLRYTDMGDYDQELDRYLSEHFPASAPRYDLTPWALVGKYAAMDTVACNKLGLSLAQRVSEQDELIEALAYRVMPAYSAAITRLEHAGCHIDVPFAKRMLPHFVEEAKKSMDAILAEPVVRRFIRDREQEEREKIAATWKDPKPRKDGTVRKKKTVNDLPPVEMRRYFDFSLDSPKQLGTLLFDAKYYGHDVVAYSDGGGPSTDKETMQVLVEKGSPIAKRIVEWRLDDKLVGTYVRPFVELCETQELPRIHPNMKIHGTKTGRLACSEPNLQNIPNKGASVIKRMFVSRYGSEGCIIQADYSQVELRILACIANDKGMIEAFIRGEDLHTLTACMIFDMTVEQFKALPEKEQKTKRTIAKRINFGIPYGVGGPGISTMLKGESIDIDADTCGGYIDKFFTEKPRVKRWIDRVQESTADDAISRSLFGRRRRLEQVKSNMNDVVARSLRQAVNHPIQSTGGDMTLTSLALMDEEIMLRRGTPKHLVMPTIDHREFHKTEGWDKVHIMLSVHDSNVVDCHRSVAGQVVEMMQRTMPNIVDLAPLVWGPAIVDHIACLKKVPMQTDVEIGPNYRDGVAVKNPADCARAMFVGDAKNVFLDADAKGTWTKDHEKAANAAFAAQVGAAA